MSSAPIFSRIVRELNLGGPPGGSPRMGRVRLVHLVPEKAGRVTDEMDADAAQLPSCQSVSAVNFSRKAGS